MDVKLKFNLCIYLLHWYLHYPDVNVNILGIFLINISTAKLTNNSGSAATII